MIKRRISKTAFLSIWCSVAVVFVSVAITAEILGDNPSFQTYFDTYLGRGEPYVVQADGSESWDTDYYGQTFPQSTNAEGQPLAKKNAVATAERIEEEGIVLLKNKDGCLPLSTDKELTLLGKGSVDPCYAVVHYEENLTEPFVSPMDGFKNAGFRVEATSHEFFSSQIDASPKFKTVENSYDQTSFFIGEVPTSDYDFTVLTEDIGVVFLTRYGAEGVDLSTDLLRDIKTPASVKAINENIRTKEESQKYAEGQHQLELSAEEKDMVAWSKAHYQKTIVVINAACPMELGALQDDPSIDAIVWAGLPGEAGFTSLGQVFSGATNPSGRTPDIYPKHFSLDPTFPNFGRNGVHEYANIDPFKVAFGDDGAKFHFVQYEEGIYFGYRYYETAGSVNGEEWYQDAVVYPFGFGLSYTSFDKEIVRHEKNGNEITMEVRVTNTGSCAGKEVVQAYVEAPFSSVEKSVRNLVAFEKTGLLAPGQSETIRLSFALDDLASYDYIVSKSWVLEAGNYVVSIMENSHEKARNSVDAPLLFEFEIPSTITLERKGDDLKTTGNLFDDVNDFFRDSDIYGYAKNFSRHDFEHSFPSSPTSLDANADEVYIDGVSLSERFWKYEYKAKENDPSNVPTGSKDGVLASSLRGADYDDSAYDRLLAQLKDSDYANADAYICNNAYAIKGIDSIGLSGADIREGTQGFFSTSFNINVCLYPCPTVLAATFNTDLGKEMGTSLGEEALSLRHRTVGWYGPNLDIHRSPFQGTYGENYSEDPVLTGLMGTAVVSAATQKGLISFVEHFAPHQQESFLLSHLCVWANEQALRELYLRPFEIVIKKAKATISYTGIAGARHNKEIPGCLGILSSTTYLGSTWAGGREDLLQTLLREQWGFGGVVSSDFNFVDYMNPMQALLAGTDIEYAWASFKNQTIRDTSSQTVRLAVRRAIKNVVYLMANSNAMQFVAPGSKVYYGISPWRIWFYVGEVAFVLAAGASVAWIIIRMKRVEKEMQFIEE